MFELLSLEVIYSIARCLILQVMVSLVKKQHILWGTSWDFANLLLKGVVFCAFCKQSFDKFDNYIVEMFLPNSTCCGLQNWFQAILKICLQHKQLKCL